MTKIECDTSFVAVANRNDGSVSFIPDQADVQSKVITVNLPNTTATAEPMYVSYAGDKVYVGDRANDAVVVLDPSNLTAAPTVITGIAKGAFHQWSNGKTLVVACDTAKSVTVVDLATQKVSKVIDLTNQGAELNILAGQKPHDIVITPDGDAILVTIVSTNEGKEGILKIDGTTLKVVKKIELAAKADGHLALSAMAPDRVFSPQQGLNKVASYSLTDLSEAQTAIIVNAAHGIGVSGDGKYVYVTDIANNGATGALYPFSVTKDGGAQTLKSAGSVVTTTVGTAHNVAVTQEGNIFVTHSGASSKAVTRFTRGTDGKPEFKQKIDVGLNPFGMAAGRYACPPTPAPTLTPVTSSSTPVSIVTVVLLSLLQLKLF